MHPKFLEILKALESRRVPYAIAGGYAVALHGAVRGTVDLDLVLGLSMKAYLSAEEVFLACGLQPRLPVGAEQVFAFRTEYLEKRNLVAWSFYDPADPTCLIDVIISYEARTPKRQRLTLSGQPVYVLQLDELIRIKTEAGRPQDQADVEALHKIAKKRKKR